MLGLEELEGDWALLVEVSCETASGSSLIFSCQADGHKAHNPDCRWTLWFHLAFQWTQNIKTWQAGPVPAGGDMQAPNGEGGGLSLWSQPGQQGCPVPSGEEGAESADGIKFQGRERSSRHEPWRLTVTHFLAMSHPYLCQSPATTQPLMWRFFNLPKRVALKAAGCL